MRRFPLFFGAVLLNALVPAYGASLRPGLGVSYLYPAGRLAEGLSGGAQVEASLTVSALPRIDLGVNLRYASVGGRENRRLKVVLSPLEVIARANVMQLTESSHIALETGAGVIGIYRTLNTGEEGALLGGEGVVSLGIGIAFPFVDHTMNLRAVYHRILDPIEKGDLFSFGALILWGAGP